MTTSSSATMRRVDLERSGLDELEEIYLSQPCGAIPFGRYRGTFLQHLDNPGTRRLDNQLIVRLGFEYTPFGIDFTANRWYFFDERLLVGHFRPIRQRSRWREADVIALHYDVSRLPGIVRELLYDEVKPLNDRLCLGLGGVNAERDHGDLFFFALERLSD